MYSYIITPKMHFCVQCRNMYYLKIQGQALVYYCRNCGHQNEMPGLQSVCVSDTRLTTSEQNYSHIINAYTKHDPTLPRTNSIPCPNQQCDSNRTSVAPSMGGKNLLADDQEGGAKRKRSSGEPKEQTKRRKEPEAESQESGPAFEPDIEPAVRPEVIYMRYDDINLKYIYMCVHCDTTWVSNQYS